MNPPVSKGLALDLLASLPIVRVPLMPDHQISLWPVIRFPVLTAREGGQTRPGPTCSKREETPC